MANHLFRNVFSQTRKHFLKSSAATLSSTSRLKNTGTSSSAFTVNFLVKNCGLPVETAISVSKKFQLDERNPQKPQSVLQLLKTHNFSDNQVAKLIIKYPRFLHFKVRNNLQPKFEYLVKNGFTGELLPHIIVSHPSAMRRSLDSTVKPSFEYLRSLLHSDEKVVTCIMRSPWFFHFANLKDRIGPNLDFLRKEGVPPDSLEKFLLSPRAVYQKPERITYAVNAVKNLGIEPTSPMFIVALRVMMRISESTLTYKIEVWKSMGFDEQQILKVVKRFPYSLAFSEAKIRNALHFYLNVMQLERKTVIVNPALVGLSVEKRVRPRYNVLKLLESKKLIEGIKKAHPLVMAEKNFLKTYVDQYKHEVPDLLEMYLGSKKIGA